VFAGLFLSFLVMNTEEKLLEFLMGYVSENRQQRFNEVIQNRTRHITMVIENVFQPHNASAVLRSCDCFGIQDVHVIENYNSYKVNPNIALGASKWLNMYKYNENEYNTVECLTSLKEKGYTLVATSPHKYDYTISELPLDNKVAVMLGTELQGLTDKAFEMADCIVNIPMFGFTESFNISVSAALIMYELTKRLHETDINWQLSKEENLQVMLDWARTAVKKSNMLEKAFRSRNPEDS
jgi:tRNA (guanosine-2'-O-)-methyltransferase